MHRISQKCLFECFSHGHEIVAWLRVQTRLDHRSLLALLLRLGVLASLGLVLPGVPPHRRFCLSSGSGRSIVMRVQSLTTCLPLAHYSCLALHPFGICSLVFVASKRG